MIRDHHKIDGMEGWIGASGRIGEKKFFCPKKPHQTCRKNYVRHWISFIIMNPALHDHNRCFLYITKYKTSFVPFYCRYRKSFDICIFNDLFDLDPLCKITKSRSKNQCNFRFEIRFLSYTFQTCH